MCRPHRKLFDGPERGSTMVNLPPSGPAPFSLSNRARSLEQLRSREQYPFFRAKMYGFSFGGRLISYIFSTNPTHVTGLKPIRNARDPRRERWHVAKPLEHHYARGRGSISRPTPCRCRPRAPRLFPATRESLNHVVHLARGNCGREEETLAQVATRAAQPFKLDGRLDALGEHGHLQFATQRDDRLEQRVVLVAFVRRPHEGLVNLDDPRMNQHEVGEGGVPGTEVIERDVDP